MHTTSIIGVIGELFATTMLVCLYAFFVLGSISITKSRSARVRELVRDGFMFGKYARVILARSNIYLLACQIGAFLSALGTGVYLDEIVRPLAQSGILAFPALGLPVGLTEFLAASVLVLGFGLWALMLVQVAKLLAFTHPERILCLVSLPTIFVARILSPFLWLLRLIVTPLITRLGLDPAAQREVAPSAQEISEIVELSTQAGEIEEEECEMIQGVITLSNTSVAEVMTPRKDVIYIDQAMSLDQIIRIFETEKMSRVLVTGRDLDDVKGVLIAKDLLPLVGHDIKDFDIMRFVRKAHFVSHSRKVDDLLRELCSQGIHLAVVMDEHGGVDGVVTVEDLIEEVVGDIRDEYDSPSDEMQVEKTVGGDLLVDASISLHDLNEAHSLGFPEGQYDTLAGFVIHILGHIPDVGETLGFGGIVMKVEEMDQNRVTLVRILSSINSTRNLGSHEQGAESTAKSSDVEPDPAPKIRISGAS